MATEINVSLGLATASTLIIIASSVRFIISASLKPTFGVDPYSAGFRDYPRPGLAALTLFFEFTGHRAKFADGSEAAQPPLLRRCNCGRNPSPGPPYTGPRPAVLDIYTGRLRSMVLPRLLY